MECGKMTNLRNLQQFRNDDLMQEIKHGINMKDKLDAITKYMEYPTEMTSYDNSGLEKGFKKNHPEIEFNFKDIDSRTVNKISEVFSGVIKKYNIEVLAYVGIDGIENSPFKKLGKNCAGAMKDMSDGKFAIVLNMNWHNNIFNTIRFVEANQKSGYWAGKNKNPLYIFYHEVGHLLDEQYNLRNDKKILDIFSNESKNVSKYGATSIDDFIAESFAYIETMNVKNDNSTAWRVYQRISEMININ